MSESHHEEVMLTSIPEGTPNALPQTANLENGLGGLTVRALFDSEESSLLRFAFSLTGRRAVAEEIVQEVFMQLHAKWAEVHEPRAWLYRSVRNQAFHYLRRSRREQIGSDAEDSILTDTTTATPDELMARTETVAELRQLIGQLPEKDRRLIQLKYFEDLKYRDISQKTGLTISNVGFRLHQVLRKLAAAMLSTGVEE